MDSEEAIILHKWMTTDLHLTGGNLIIFTIIFNYSKDGVTACRSPLPYLQNWSGLTERQIYRVLGDLEKTGLIIKEYENTDKGRVVQYRVNIEKIRELRGLSSPTEPAATEEIALKKTEEHPVIAEAFEVFWQAYLPTNTRDGSVAKGSKKLAKARYQRIVKNGTQPEEILKGLENYLEFCQQNGRFTCHAAVFLSQERWKDWINWVNPSDDLGI